VYAQAGRRFQRLLSLLLNKAGITSWITLR
jgi:hypothetical protein